MEIVVQNENDFGANNLALCSTCGGGEESEVVVSHVKLALGAKARFTRLLRSKTKDDAPSKLLLTGIAEGYSTALDEKTSAAEAKASATDTSRNE